MPEPTQAVIELNNRSSDALGELQKMLQPANWPQRQRTLFEPNQEEAKLNAAVKNSLHKELNLPRSMVLTPHQVDEVSKKLKLSDTAKSYLHAVAKEGPIDEGLLNVIHIEKPQANKFPFKMLPAVEDFSVADAKDFLKFISADDPSKALDGISKRSTIGHLLKSVQSSPDQYKQLKNDLRKSYLFDENSLDEVASNDIIRELIAKGGDIEKNIIDYIHKKPPSEWGVWKNIFSKKKEELENKFIAPINKKANLPLFQYEKAALNPVVKKEMEARKRLIDSGMSPNDPAMYAPYAGKYTPREIADIVKNGPTKKGIEGDIEYVTALQQARDLHEKRTGEAFTAIPTVVDTVRENPYVYPGNHAAPTADELKKGWDIGIETGNKLEQNRLSEEQRLNALINSIKKDPELANQLSKETNYIKNVPDQLESLRGQFFGKDMADSPIYKAAQKRNMGLYDLAKQEYMDRMDNEVVPELRGRYMKIQGINFAGSPGYKEAIARAEKARNQYLTEMRLKYENQAHNQALQEMQHLYNPQKENYLAQLEASKQSAVMQQELWKASRERRVAEEELQQKAEKGQTANRLAQQELHSSIGKEKQAEEQRLLNDKITQFNLNGPAGDLARQVVQQGAQNQTPQSVPYQPIVQPPNMSVIPPSGSGALGAGLSGMVGQYLAQQQQQAAAQQPVHIHLPGAQKYAEGGVVQAPQYNELMAQQLAAIQQFMQEKERHQNLPTMAVNPYAQTFGNMATAMGEAMGPRSMMGGWAKGMGTAPHNHNEHLDKQYKQSLNKAQLEQVLADLRKDATVVQRDREHNLATEDLKQKELLEQARHHLASEGLSAGQLEEMRRYHDLEANEKKNKREELSESDLVAISKNDHTIDGTLGLSADAAVMSAIAPFVNSGPIMGRLGTSFLGKLSGGNTTEGVNFFDDMTRNFAVDRVKEFGGVRSNFLANMVQQSKMNLSNTPETNVSRAREFVIKSVEPAVHSMEDQMKRGKPISDILGDLKELDVSKRDQIKLKVFEFGKAQNLSDEKIASIEEKALEQWDDAIDKIATRLENFYKRHKGDR